MVDEKARILFSGLEFIWRSGLVEVGSKPPPFEKRKGWGTRSNEPAPTSGVRTVSATLPFKLGEVVSAVVVLV
jgi:hypothetical protein